MNDFTEAVRRLDGWAVRTTALAAVLLTAYPPNRLASQGVLSQFSYDNLRLSGIQADLGALGSSKLTGAIVGGLRVDYGQIAPHVRLLLGLSYFRSDFDAKTRARFEERIKSFVTDPSGDDVIQVGRISWSDLIGDLDLQWVLPQGHVATTYLGAGVGVHVRNGSGDAIKGTFVEDALDDITAALNVTVGAEFHAGPVWRFTLDGRGVIASGLSTVSLRGGIMYRFGKGEGRRGKG